MKRFLFGLIATILLTTNSQAAFFIPDAAVTRSKLAVGAIARQTLTAQSSTYSVSTSVDAVYMSGSSFTATLPTAVGVSGKVYYLIHDGTSLTQVYTLNTTSSQTIGGIASGSYALYTNGEVLAIQSDGSNWKILYHQTDTDWASFTVAYSTVATYDSTITAVTKPSGITTDTGYWRRRGNVMQYRITYVATNTSGGSVTAGAIIITNPGSVTTDTTIAPRVETAFFGTGAVNYTGKCGIVGSGMIMNSSTANNSDAIVFPYNSSYLIVLVTRSNSFWLSNFLGLQNASGTISANLNGEIPVSGWRP